MEVIAVVRACGERTEAECISRVRAQVEEVRVIHVAPFHEAVRECFRIAIDSGASWLLTVDADVLLHPRAVKSILAQAKKWQGWQVVGRVSDRMSGRDRMAGVRMYRANTLPAVLPYVPEVVRPEGTLARLFAGWEPSKDVMGLHDHEQWYADYHRKGAQHRAKHPEWTELARKWRKSGDPELIAAARGWDGEPLGMAERDGYQG